MTEDGSIVINTKIRTDGIKAGTAEIEAGVHRAADRVNTLGSNVKKTLNNQIDSFVKLNDEYSTQEQKVESLRKKPQKQRKTTCHRSMKLIGTQQIRIPTQHRLDPVQTEHRLAKCLKKSR